ncbi:hypothetical protein ACVCAH_17495 [Micromonospora sp. LZ34]
MAIRPGVIAAVAAVVLAAGCDAPDDATPDGTTTPGASATTTAPGGGATITAAPGRAGQGEVRITTQLGEQCPHIPATPDPRCDPEPRSGTGFEIRSTTRDFVARGRSGPDGRATVPVAADTYLVRGEPIEGYRFTPERRVTVGSDATVDVPLTYTNGIQ